MYFLVINSSGGELGMADQNKRFFIFRNFDLEKFVIKVKLIFYKVLLTNYKLSVHFFCGHNLH